MRGSTPSSSARAGFPKSTRRSPRWASGCGRRWDLTPPPTSQQQQLAQIVNIRVANQLTRCQRLLVSTFTEKWRDMPLWKVYAPAGAYSDEDKQAKSEAITSVYAQVPIPKFYVVTVFEEIPDGDLFVGGVKNARFVRFRVDHIARTLPGPILREWWV